MTPHDIIANWRHTEQKERSASQSHFNDLCALLGLVDPISADPKGEWFAFKKGAISRPLTTSVSRSSLGRRTPDLVESCRSD